MLCHNLYFQGIQLRSQLITKSGQLCDPHNGVHEHTNNRFFLSTDDNSLVLLTELEAVEGSEYINASFIHVSQHHQVVECIKVSI